ncbi:MAG: Na+/H+ antiporter NhaC family protein [Woeseiaceae bacterium]|nr:Na+/H+ antiporter NhaC family protein [Woeseiaceae bacterium]
MTEPASPQDDSEDTTPTARGAIRGNLWIGILLFCAGVGWYATTLDADSIAANSHYGVLSIMPAVGALAICFITRNVILALFIGVVLGGLVSTDYNIIQAYLIPALGTPRFAEILLVYLWALGGLLGLWNRNGGAWHFATWISENYVKSRRSAMFFAWLMGIIFHQGGTISTVLTGTTVRPIADREKVAHEELAYIVDSTASPVATIIPFNVWPVYVAGLIAIPSMTHFIAGRDEAIAMFLDAIWFNFYGWFAILFTLLFALGLLPFMGRKMRAAQRRVLTTGELDAPGAEPMISKELTTVDVADGYTPSLLDFFVPIGVLFTFAIVPWLITGAPMIFEAFGLAVVSGVIVSMMRGMSTKDAFDALVDGIKGVSVGAIILGLAVTLAKVSETLGASAWVIDVSADNLTAIPYILPGLLMIICMTVSFSVGSSWGTYAVVFPIALPLAYAISADPLFVTLSFAAILGGAVFGDQCSPISDTTILASLACGSDLMDHVLTQLPMALTAAGIAMTLYTGIAFFIT